MTAALLMSCTALPGGLLCMTAPAEAPLMRGLSIWQATDVYRGSS